MTNYSAKNVDEYIAAAPEPAGFDAFKNHVSFEIWADELAAKDRKTLEEHGYKTGKRTFQIRYDQEVPSAVIKSLVTAQAKVNEGK